MCAGFINNYFQIEIAIKANVYDNVKERLRKPMPGFYYSIPSSLYYDTAFNKLGRGLSSTDLDCAEALFRVRDEEKKTKV